MNSSSCWIAIPLVASGIAFGAVMQQVQAQDTSADSRLRLKVARFWRGEGRTLLDGVVGVPLEQAARNVDLTVRDSTGKALYTEAWTDTASQQVGVVAGMNAETTIPLEVLLQPGLYTVEVRRRGANEVDSLSLQLRGFAAAPVISDVVTSARMRVLAENEEPSAEEMKRGRYAIERGTRVTVHPSEPRLWYYLELYRQGADSLAQLEFRILPQGRDTALVRVTRNVAVSARGTVDAAALVVQGLPPGEYTLKVIAKSGNREEMRAAPFTMGSFETDAPATGTAPGAGIAEATLFDRYFAAGVRGDAEVTEMVEALTVGAPGTRAGSDALQYTTDAKRRFLARYWSRVPDPDPATPTHELIDEYAQRVRHVNREYAEKRGRSGVKSDKGRIYLKYGAPDATHAVEIPGTRKTVEVWKYTRRRALKFVFLDETGFRYYNLIYTTDPQERTVADWQERVFDSEIIRQIVTF